MQNQEHWSESEKLAFRQGFLFGVYSEYPLLEFELNEKNPYSAGSPEFDRWKEGYYVNLT